MRQARWLIERDYVPGHPVRRWQGLRIFLLAAGLMLLLGAPTLGQEATGTIYGRVTDSQGFSQQVLVHLFAEGDIPAGDVYTQGEGNYAFGGLPGGEYWVVVEADGFQPIRQAVNLNAQINPKAQSNVVLERTASVPGTPQPVISRSTSSHTVDARKPLTASSAKALREFDRGNASQQKGDLRGAIGHYEKAVRIEPSFYPAFNNLGAAYERQGDHKRAESTLLKALEINPSDGESHVNLGHVLYEEGRYPEAVARLREALKRSPNSAAGHFFLGSSYLKLGDLERAESSLKHACVLEPRGLPAAHLQLANLYLRTRKLAAAEAELQNYLRANPTDPQAPAIRRLLANIEAQND